MLWTDTFLMVFFLAALEEMLEIYLFEIGFQCPELIHFLSFFFSEMRGPWKKVSFSTPIPVGHNERPIWYLAITQNVTCCILGRIALENRTLRRVEKTNFFHYHICGGTF